KRLAKQRAARKELERKARLEQEKMTAAQGTAKKLAKERAARKELERKAGLEREKMDAARKAAKKLAEERIRAEKRPAEAAASKSERPKPPIRTGRAVASFPESEVGSYDEDDGDDIVMDAKESLANDAAEVGVATDSTDTGVVGLLETSSTDEDEKDESVEFAANPCAGKTARFLSTCR
ncbi:MAG: hypothetical protein GWP20_01010, partial [Thermotogales bacterium]|nr:hypothetical protein [Thermotogales bacterium]